MARPVKADAEKRSKGVTVWLTPADHASLVVKAAASGASLSDFLHRAAQGRAMLVTASHAANDALPFALADALRRVGINLNQLTRLANLGIDLGVKRPGQLDALSSELSGLLDQVHAVAARRSR